MILRMLHFTDNVLINCLNFNIIIIYYVKNNEQIYILLF